MKSVFFDVVGVLFSHCAACVWFFRARARARPRSNADGYKMCTTQAHKINAMLASEPYRKIVTNNINAAFVRRTESTWKWACEYNGLAANSDAMELSQNDYSTSRPPLFLLRVRVCISVLKPYFVCVCVFFRVRIRCVHFHPINIHYHSLYAARTCSDFRFIPHMDGRRSVCVHAFVDARLCCVSIVFFSRQTPERLSTRLSIMYLSQVMREQRYSTIFFYGRYRLRFGQCIRELLPKSTSLAAAICRAIQMRADKKPKKKEWFRPN